jgi:hypothetical protein
MEEDMNATHRRITMAGALLVLWAAFAGARAADDVASDRPRDTAESMIPVRQQWLLPPFDTAAPARAGTPGVRDIDAEDAVTGSEPDPESFDRHGLETWWQKFRESAGKRD